jgi:hypothetical protein
LLLVGVAAIAAVAVVAADAAVAAAAGVVAGVVCTFVLLCFCAHGFGQVIDDNPVVSISCVQSNDVTEAISSHMEKRKPVFAKL